MGIVSNTTVAAGGMLLALGVVASMGNRPQSPQTQTSASPVELATAVASSRPRPALTPPVPLRAEPPTIEAEHEEDDLPTAIFESRAVEPGEFTEDVDDAAILAAEQALVAHADVSSELDVDPASEGFDSMEEMEAFVREQFDVGEDVAIRFRKTLKNGEEHLSIAFVPHKEDAL